MKIKYQMPLIQQYPKNKPIRLTGKKKRKLRQDCYERAGGHCEECDAPAPWDGGVMYRGHMAHIKSYGAGGGDTLDNVKWKCATCHVGNGGEHGPRWTNGKEMHNPFDR